MSKKIPAGPSAKAGNGAETALNRREEELLVDKTSALSLHSKRTERLQKKQLAKIERKKRTGPVATIHDLPVELFALIISYLRPSDIFRLQRTNKSLHKYIADHEAELARSVISFRYPIIEQCFRRPVPLSQVDPACHSALQFPGRPQIQHMAKKPFQHVLAPDPQVLCTCLTCLLRWNALNIAVDFAFFQNHLDKGEPLPMIPRGQTPKWNRRHVLGNALVVARSLDSELLYARILERHLDSTVRSITRHKNNKGNRRSRFRMDESDVGSGTDEFLSRSGPPTVDFPYHRDNYYMLESYFPNRGWATSGEEKKWFYVPAEQHDRDIEMVVKFDPYLRKQSLDDINAAKSHKTIWQAIIAGEKQALQPV